MAPSIHALVLLCFTLTGWGCQAEDSSMPNSRTAADVDAIEAEEASASAVLLLQQSLGTDVQPPLRVQSNVSESSLVGQVSMLQSVSEVGTSQLDMRKCVGEFIAMALFVFIGCGSAMSIAKEPGSAWVLQVSLTFGLAISVLAYALGKYSGAQINCAVTLGLVIYGEVTVVQGICNLIAQLLGSVLAAAVLKFMYPPEKDLTGGLGTNAVGEGWTSLGALIGEFVGTFLLMYVVFETAVNPAAKASSALAPLAIGLAVFLAHSVLIPVDGCSINPTRSFGPAVVEAFAGGKGAPPFRDMWIFWLGPCLGAAAATGVYALMTL